MALIKNIIIFSTGLYIGVFMEQNYKLPRVDNPQEYISMINEWLEKNKKDSGKKD